MISFRDAVTADLADIIRMLADDPLGAQRENPNLPLNDSYIIAFEHISKDPNNELIVVEQADQLIGMLQLTFIPYLRRP